MTLQASTTTDLLTRSQQQLRTQLLRSEVKSGGPSAPRLPASTVRSATIEPGHILDRTLERRNRLFEGASACGQRHSSNSSSSTAQYKKAIYKIILIQIKLLISIIRFLNVTCLQFYYFVYVNFERLKYARLKRLTAPRSRVSSAGGEDTSSSSLGDDPKSLMSTFADGDSSACKKDSLFHANESSLHPTRSSLDASRPPTTFSLSVDAASLPARSETTPFGVDNNFRIDGLVHVPAHACVIFNEFVGRPDYEMFECIANVMAANNVKMLSFYNFKEISSEIRTRILNRFQASLDPNNNVTTCKASKTIDNDFKYNEAVINDRKVKLTNPNEKPNEGVPDASGGQICVNFLTFNANGGQCVLAKVARTMATKVSNDLMTLGEINQEMIETHIIEAYDFVEPQLLISIGQSDCLAGFSPWHLRLCEIFKVQSTRIINPYTIRDILVKFSKIEKRFGK